MSKLFTLVVEIETWRVRSFQYPNYSKIARALNPYNNHCFADQVDEEHLRPATSELKRSVIASKSEAEAGSRARSVKLPNAIYHRKISSHPFWSDHLFLDISRSSLVHWRMVRSVVEGRKFCSLDCFIISSSPPVYQFASFYSA